jgi:hypothetical protein
LQGASPRVRGRVLHGKKKCLLYRSAQPKISKFSL